MPEKISYPDPMAQPGPIPEKQMVQEQSITTESSLGELTEKELKSWWEKIQRSDDMRKKDVETTFKKAIEYVKGKQFDKDTPDAVVVNYLASTFWIIKNYIYAQSPEYKTVGKNPIGEITAPIAEMALNYFTKESDADEENGVAIIDALMAGEGYVLDTLSTDIVTAKIPKKETEYPAGGEQVNGDDTKKPEQLEFAEYIKTSKPITARISPFDMLKDPDSTSSKRSRWLGRWIRKKPLSDIISDQKYRKDAIDRLNKMYRPDDGKVIDLVEIQVKRLIGGEPVTWRLVLPECDHSIYLYYAPEEYVVDGFNYSILQFKKLGDDTYALSEFLSYKPIQDLINQVHSKIWEQVSKSMTQPVANEDMLTKKGKTALLAGEGVITVKTGMNPASLAIAQAETSRVHGDLWRYENITRDMFRITSGVSEAMRAGVERGSQTLGELQLIQGGTNVIMGGYVKELKRFLIAQGRKRLQIIRQLPTTEYIPIAGYKDKIPKEFIEGAFVKFSRDYILGEYDLDLDVSTMKAQDETRERAEIKDMIVTLAQVDPLLRQEGKRVKVSKLVEDWIRTKKRFNTDEYIEDLRIRNPDEENMGMLLMAQTGQLIPINVQEGEDLETHARKHQEFMAGPLKSLIPTAIWLKIMEPHLSQTLMAIEEKKSAVNKAVKK
jgi:hypothetical protein